MKVTLLLMLQKLIWVGAFLVKQHDAIHTPSNQLFTVMALPLASSHGA